MRLRDSYAEIVQEASEAAQYIADGRIVAVPTGTSYGLAVDALQGWALQRLRLLKRRPQTKTFTVAVRQKDWRKYLRLTDEERALLSQMQDSALTVLVEPADSLAHLAQDGRIGVRTADHPHLQDLLAATRVPLTATSANIADTLACQDTACILQSFPGIVPADQLGEEHPRGAVDTTYNLSLAAIIDGGSLPASAPSTIARIAGGQIEIVRDGAVSLEELTAALP